jgi:predicted metal-dependent hydrolase
MAELPRSLTIDGMTFPLSITRKKVKNINLRLVDGEFRASAPRSVPDDELEAVIENLARRLVRRERARTINRADDALRLARRVARRFDPPPEIAAARFSTRQNSRWGSYSLRTRTIHLNAAVRTMPTWVLEAVVAHELAHVTHPNHSPAFWDLLRRVCPETDRARAFLEGVSWLGGAWDDLPPVERSLLSRG